MSFTDLRDDLAIALDAYNPDEPRDESGKWTSGGGSLYHVTFTKHAKAITKRGVQPGKKPVWEKAAGGKYKSPHVFAFNHKDDAVRWAARMDWEFHQGHGTGKVSIVHLKSSKGDEWLIDDRDPLSQVGSKGEWLKRAAGVDPKDVEKIEPLTQDMIRDLVKRQNAADSVRADWDESKHPRGQPENKGEFASKPGGGADEPDMFGKLQGIEFVSPNIREGTKLREARRGLKQARHKFIVNAGAEVDKALGVEADTKPVIGMWADGAENSTMSIMENPPWETLVKSAAMKGWLAKQKQVLIFKEGDTDPTHGDEAGLASFSAKGKPEEISQWLGENGLPYHTLAPTTDKGFTVFVYGNDNETGHALVKAGEHYGSEVTVRRGRGAFLGTHKEDGSDAEQRADARAEYDRLLVQSGDQGTAKLWQGLRDRLGPQADQVVSDQTETPHFKAWFGDSKIVDEDGAPQVMYHGTLGNFESFDKSRASVEGNWGAGFYFTNDPEDLSHNYAGRGPDITNKLENMADLIEQEDDFEGDHQEALKRAEEMVQVANEGAAVPVFLKMEKPFKVGGKNETHLDFSMDYDEENDEYGEPHGKAQELIEAIREIGKSDEYQDNEGVDNLANDLLDHAMSNDGIQASKLELIASGAANYAYVSDSEGKLVASEILRKALQKIGFDGIIDTRVSQKFTRMGLKPDSTHYVVFDPHQIKSAIGNKGTFSPQSTKITDSQPVVRADAYNPNEARIPKGEPGGGQWTASGGGGMGFTESKPVEGAGEGVKVWHHEGTGGMLTVTPEGKWYFTGGNDNQLEGMGNNEESLNKFINVHKAELKPMPDPLMKTLGFKYNPKISDDTLTYYNHPSGHGIEFNNETGGWVFTSHDDKQIPDATGNANTLPNWLATHKTELTPKGQDLIDLMPKLGLKELMIDSSEGWRTFSTPGGDIIHINPANGDWKWKPGSGGDAITGTGAHDLLDDLSHSKRSFRDKAKDLLADLPPEGDPLAPHEWTPHPQATEGVRGESSQALAAKLEKQFVEAAPELDAMAAKLYKDKTPVDEDEEPEPPTPEEWEGLSTEQQEETEQKWKENNKSDFYDSEVSSWQDSGQPLHDAKMALAEEGADAEYADETVQTFLDDWAGDADDPVPVPYTKEQLLASLSVTFHDKYDDGASDPEFTFDNDELRTPTDLAYDPATQGVLPGMERPEASSHFTAEMRKDLAERLTEAFNKKAENDAGDMEAPDYLSDSVDESMDDYWGQMDDDAKFDHAKNLLDLDEGKPNKQAAVEKLDRPPRKYDPLSFDAHSNDYTRTRHISRALSIARAEDVLRKRGLIKTLPPEITPAGKLKKFNDAQATWQEGATDEVLKTLMMHGAKLDDVSTPETKELLAYAYDMLYSAPVENVAYGGDWTKAKPASEWTPDAEAASQRFAVKLIHAADLSGPSVQFKKDIIDKELSPEEKAVFDTYHEKLRVDMAATIARQLQREQGKHQDPGDQKAAVERIDSKLWRDWVGASTSFGGKMIQIAAADEFGGHLRIPPPPKLEPEPIKEATDEELVKLATPAKNNTENADLRRAIYPHLQQAMMKNREKLPPELKGLAAVATTAVVNLMDLSLDKDGRGRLEFGTDDRLEPEVRRVIETLRPEIDEAVRKGFTARREDINAKRRGYAEEDAKLKYGGYTPISEDAAMEGMKNLPSPAHMLAAFQDKLNKLNIELNAQYGLAKRMARQDFWQDAVTKKDGQWSFDPAKFDVAGLIDPTFPNRTEYRDALDKPEAREELAKAAQGGFEAFKKWADDAGKEKARTKYQADLDDAWEPKDKLIEQADRDYADIGGYKGVKALMRAKWETTQWMMAKAGVHEFSAYRAILDPQVNGDDIEKVDVEAAGRHFTKLPGYKLMRNGAASTALKASVSNNWHSHKGGDRDRVVLRVRLPRTAALSVPSYGQNEAAEREVIVMGTAWKDWDAYKEKAPEFEELAIGAEPKPKPKPEFDYGIKDLEEAA